MKTTSFFAMFDIPDEPHGSESEPTICFFDSVSKTSFDKINSTHTLASYADRDRRKQSLQLAVWQVDIDDVRQLNEGVLDDAGQSWWQIEVTDWKSNEGIPATFLSLAADRERGASPRVRISMIAKLPDAKAAALDTFFAARGLARGTGLDIKELLEERLREFDDELHIAVYDMGQANCNAIVNCYEHPLVFFDLGWPIQANNVTIPSQKPDLFVCESGKRDSAAPVILSHWDWDHWAYAIDSWKYSAKTKSAIIKWNPVAIARNWIVPRPIKSHKLGPSHWALFAELLRTRVPSRKRALTMWPNGVQELAFSRGLLVHCSPPKGAPADRNNTGLALFVSKRINARKTEAILLPADAEFSSIPLLEKVRKKKDTGHVPLTLVGLVASHHGGKINVYAIPKASISGARLAVSSGSGNQYGHPNKQALENYTYRGWKNHALTQTRVICANHSAKTTHVSNSIVLSFTGAAKPACGCKKVQKGFLCLN